MINREGVLNPEQFPDGRQCESHDLHRQKRFSGVDHPIAPKIFATITITIRVEAGGVFTGFCLINNDT